MKPRQPSKPRNMAAQAMHSCKIFAAKSIAPKKGKGSYQRKGRDDRKGSPDLYHFADTVFIWYTRLTEGAVVCLSVLSNRMT